MPKCEREGCENEARPDKRTCSRSCASKIGWLRNRAKRIASISAAQRRRGPEIVEQNRQRWARPGEREKLSQRNREAWADPETRERLSAAIAARNGTPQMREFYSEMRRALWRDPEYRARVTEIVRESHRTPQYRALFGRLLQERWKDPAWREKWIAGMRRHYDDPDAREAHAELMRQKHADPEWHAAWLAAVRQGRINRKLAKARRSQAPVTLQPIPAPTPRQEVRSAARVAEEDAIAAFMASKGVTQLPSSREALSLPEPVYDREKRKWVRPAAPAKH